MRVPNVVGQDISVAQPNLVDSAGFKIVIQEVPSSKPKGEVIGTNPTGGTTADKGSTVTVQVSSGDIVMPSLIGLTTAQAMEKLRQAGWTGTSAQISQSTQGTFDTNSVGRIVSQQPAAGASIAKTGTVSITTYVLGPP
jgi:beta-lactam-binding protein with PASTA domain